MAKMLFACFCIPLTLIWGCDLVSNDEEEPVPEPIQTRADEYVVEVIGGFYHAEIEFSYTNLTDSTVYLPICGSSIPQPVMEKRVERDWKIVYTLPHVAFSCEAFVCLEPGEEHAGNTLLLTASPQGTPNSEPLFDSPTIEGEYRLVWDVYSYTWTPQARPFEPHLLPLKERISNTFRLVEAG